MCNTLNDPSNREHVRNKTECNYKNTKKHHACEKDYFWSSARCSSKNGKYLKSIIDDSVIMCDEIIEETETMKKATCKTKKVYFLLAFLLITIISPIAIYYHLIKYGAKQKHLLSYHITNNI